MDTLDILLNRYSDAKGARSSYDDTLSEVGRYVWPSMKTMVKSAESETEGRVLTVDIYDSTAIDAAYRMASGIFSYLMPTGVKWFDFIARRYMDNEDPMVKLWLSKAGQEVHKELWRSNFQKEMFATIRSLCVFGTGAISIEKIKKETVYTNYSIGSIFYEEDYNGIVDTVFRQIFYTARKAHQKFGEKAGKSVLNALKGNTPNQKFEFVHCVFPNKDYDGKYGSKKFASVFINIQDKVQANEQNDGFSYLPYLVVRMNKSPDETVGRSPGIEFLPEIKMLNAMKKTFIESSEKQGNPPLLLEDDGVVGQPVTSPGGTVIIRAGAKTPEYLLSGVDTRLTAECIAAQQQIVKDAFFNNLFRTLEDYRNMTATEVMGRREEGLVILSPTVGAVTKELIDPLVMIQLSLLDDDQLEKAPDGLELTIAYQGRLALAMSAMQTNAIEATLAKWQPYTEQYPVFDNLDVDKAFRLSAITAGVPAEVMKDIDVMNAQRQENQVKQQAMMDAKIADDASKAYKNVNQPIEQGSLAGML
jgi:hypothetical protein